MANKSKVAKKYKIRKASMFVVGAGVMLLGRPIAHTKYKLRDNGDLRKIDPPYILLINHASVADTYSMPVMLYPKTAASFIVSETAFTRWGNVLKLVGAIPKKQFSVDTTIIRNIRNILSQNRPVVIYPEGKYSVDGTANTIQPSIAKMIKLCKVPVVTMKFDGSYLHHPRWANKSRVTDVIPTVQYISAEDVSAMTVVQLHDTIVDKLAYNDYQYQRDNKVVVKSKHLVEGLEYILHRCPKCGKAHAMSAKNDTLSCSQCDLTVTMDCYGVLHGCQFDSIPQWNNWQNQLLQGEIDSGEYSISTPCKILQQIGNKYKLVGRGTLTHDDSGINMVWGDNHESFPNGLFYTTSFENNALFLPTPNALYKVFVEGVGTSVTINYAIEHYYARANK